MKTKSISVVGALAAWMVLAAAGCTTCRVSNTARTPEEQGLLSRAADQAIGESADFSVYAGKRVYIDASNLECVDKPYVVDALRQALSAAGAHVVDKPEAVESPAPPAKAAGSPQDKDKQEKDVCGGCCVAMNGSGDEDDTEDSEDGEQAGETVPPPVRNEGADVIVTVRAGMLATQQGESLLGIPAFKIPVPMLGTVETPEVALFKRVRQDGKARLCISGYTRADRAFVEDGSGEGIGRANITRWSVLILIHFTTASENAQELK